MTVSGVHTFGKKGPQSTAEVVHRVCSFGGNCLSPWRGWVASLQVDIHQKRDSPFWAVLESAMDPSNHVHMPGSNLVQPQIQRRIQNFATGNRTRSSRNFGEEQGKRSSEMKRKIFRAGGVCRENLSLPDVSASNSAALDLFLWLSSHPPGCRFSNPRVCYSAAECTSVLSFLCVQFSSSAFFVGSCLLLCVEFSLFFLQV